MTSATEYEDVEPTGRDIVAASAGVVVIQWKLNRAPDPEWAQFLVYAGSPKTGSLSFVMTNPVVTGNQVRITVPDGDLEAAVRWVEASIREANESFRRRVLPSRQQEAERLQAQQAADRSQLDSARDRLRRLDGPG